jgi:hypothetical protein
MKAIPESSYLAAEGYSRPIPLERFLPDCPVGVVSRHLSQSTGEGGWVLDPFGSNPLLDLEAAASGKRVLVVANNPILAFLLKRLAQPRPKNDYLSALSELASLPRGSERLETHIKGLYETRCPACHTLIQASGYIWQRGLNRPQAKRIHCPICGNEDELPLSDEDLLIFEPLQRGEKLPYARAIGQVLGSSQDDRPAVEEALKLYNARSLYVLFTLLNKLEGMDLTPEKKECLEALMISALDAGTSLWPWPNNGDPPRLLNVPAVYLEKNIWKEIEDSILLWSQPAQPVELTVWPDLPDGAGICLFRGPIRSLTLTDEVKIEQILALPPRPNQALWTLSALWSAWLWGRQTETSFSQVLGRRRFDWHWHTHALHHVLSHAHKLGTSAPSFTIIGEPSPGMVLATTTAANCAGYELSGLAYQSPADPIQMSWASQKGDKKCSANVQSIARSAIQELLDKLGEPAEYLTLFSAVTASLAVNEGLPADIEQYTQEKSSELQGIIARLFGDRDFLCRFDNTAQELDSGKWGLANPRLGVSPLADQVENRVLVLLQEIGTISTGAMRRRLSESLTGFMTPPPALVEFCLRAYADWQRETDTWTLKTGETVEERDRDLDEITRLLLKVVEKLGTSLEGEAPLVWKLPGNHAYRFWVSNTACAAAHSREPEDGIENVLVMPGSRAELLKYKLLRDPQLRGSLEQGWHFLKFRTLRSLAARPDLSPAVWQMMLDSDPIALEESMQLRMFG